MEIQLFLIITCCLCISSILSAEKIDSATFLKEVEALDENIEARNVKNNSGINAVFITPWEKAGMEAAKKYAKKIDIIIPTWFELKPEVLHGSYNTQVSVYLLYIID